MRADRDPDVYPWGAIDREEIKGTNGAYYRGACGDNTTAVRLHRIDK